MSKTRANSPISDVDALARQEGIQSLKEESDRSRTFEAFGRSFLLAEAAPGKVGIFLVSSTPIDDPDAASYEGTLTHAKVAHLFRRARKWKERVP